MKYNKQCAPQKSIQTVEQLTRSINKLFPYPLTSQISNLVAERKYMDVINFVFDYTQDFEVDDLIGARQIQALFSKQDFIKLGIDREAAAFQKFIDSEAMCAQTNERLDRNQPSTGVASVLHYASGKIDNILGDVPSMSEMHFSFGPGATTSTKSVTASPRAKMSDPLECSINLLPTVGRFLAEFPLLTEAQSNVRWTTQDENPEECFTTEHYGVPVSVAVGKLAFVPKDCTKHRSIVVEPSLNGLGQKGIGKYLKERLCRAGVDLKDQTRNQRLAYEGSITGTLATIDLSMASDCISRELVWNLLPFEWASLLDDFRTPIVSYRPKGAGKASTQIFELQKFSSMGNAYTFELESLIFYSLSFSVCKYLDIDTCNVSVYGDDIIVPVEAYDLLEEVLNYCGFLLNKKKSFKEGHFRESCGVDYYKGIDIRPFYLKTGISGRTLFVMHNFFFRNGDFSIAKEIEDMIPQPLRLYGPNGYGDGHLLGEWHPRTNRKLKRQGFDGGFFDTYTANPKTIRGHRFGDYVYPSYSIYAPPEEEYSFESGEFILPEIGTSSEDSMYTVRGTCGYAKVSIYTLARTTFVRESLK